MKKTNKTDYMALALEAAKTAADAGEVPVGAVMVDRGSGEVIVTTHNLVETDKDPTAHAEVLAIRAAGEKLKDARLRNCDLYVTLEPCAMCAAAISHARIHTVHYGAYDPKSGGVDHGARVFDHATCHHKPEVISGLREQEAAALLKQFFETRR